MKRVALIALAAVVSMTMVTPSQAQKARKLPEGAYLKSAKIEILSKDAARRETAIALLDSLFMYYGPHAEGQYLMAQISVDKLNEAKDFETRQQSIQEFNRWHAELSRTCGDESVKKKYREGCADHATLIDSLVVLYWRQFYNEGVEQLNRIQEAATSLSTEQDSTARAFYQTTIDVTSDSAVQVMTLAVMLDSSQYQPYLGIAQAYEAKKQSDKAVEWLEKGIPYAEDKGSMLLQVAYAYAQNGKYCEAIKPFKEYVALNPQDTANLYNLAVSYTNCKMYDSAQMVNHQILTIDPNHGEALANIGRFWNTKGRQAVDSMQHARDANREADAKKFDEQKNMAFDSAKVYLERAFAVSPDNKALAYEYGITSYIVGDYTSAAKGYGRLGELDPQNLDAWISLGDSHLNLRQWKEAASAYEKAVAIDPSKKELWERLSGLYIQLGDQAKSAEAAKKAK